MESSPPLPPLTSPRLPCRRRQPGHGQTAGRRDKKVAREPILSRILINSRTVHRLRLVNTILDLQQKQKPPCLLELEGEARKLRSDLLRLHKGRQSNRRTDRQSERRQVLACPSYCHRKSDRSGVRTGPRAGKGRRSRGAPEFNYLMDERAQRNGLTDRSKITCPPSLTKQTNPDFTSFSINFRVNVSSITMNMIPSTSLSLFCLINLPHLKKVTFINGNYMYSVFQKNMGIGCSRQNCPLGQGHHV